MPGPIASRVESPTGSAARVDDPVRGAATCRVPDGGRLPLAAGESMSSVTTSRASYCGAAGSSSASPACLLRRGTALQGRRPARALRDVKLGHFRRRKNAIDGWLVASYIITGRKFLFAFRFSTALNYFYGTSFLLDFLMYKQ